MDGQCIDLSYELKKMGYQTKIYETLSQELNDISLMISTIHSEINLKRIKENKHEENEFYYEVGGLNHILSGAVYSSAFRDGTTAIYLDENDTIQKIRFVQAPDISRISYLPRLTLDILHENGKMDINMLARLLYADQIINMDEEEQTEFFKQNHNTYKVMGKLVEKGWIHYNKNGRLYEITELGNMARVMLNLKNEKRTKGLNK